MFTESADFEQLFGMSMGPKKIAQLFHTSFSNTARVPGYLGKVPGISR